jgi:hypothetical protein
VEDREVFCVGVEVLTASNVKSATTSVVMQVFLGERFTSIFRSDQMSEQETTSKQLAEQLRRKPDVSA